MVAEDFVPPEAHRDRTVSVKTAGDYGQPYNAYLDPLQVGNWSAPTWMAAAQGKGGKQLEELSDSKSSRASALPVR
jgi:hypothetical protein